MKPGTELWAWSITPMAWRARGLGTAKKFAKDFSVATECGFGRRDPATLNELLRIHAEVAKDC
jgi:hypothetical protein